MKLVSTILLALTIAFAIGCKTDEANTAPGAVGAACSSCTGGCSKDCKAGSGASCNEACKEAGKCTGACKESGTCSGACGMHEKADPNLGALGDKYNLPSCGGEATCPSSGTACPSGGKTCPSSGKTCPSGG